MCPILLVSILFITPLFIQDTLSDGFYLTVDCALQTGPKRWSVLDGQHTVCLSQQPFLSIREIDNVTGIIESNPMRYFDVHISAKAAEQLSIVKASLKDATIALVVDNQVVFVIRPDTTIERILRIMVFTPTIDLYGIHNTIIEHVGNAKGQ